MERAKYFERYEELTYGHTPHEYAKRIFWNFSPEQGRSPPSIYDYMGEVYHYNKEEEQNDYTNCFCIKERSHYSCYFCSRKAAHMSLYMKLSQLIERHIVCGDIIKKVKIFGSKIYHTYE